MARVSTQVSVPAGRVGSTTDGLGRVQISRASVLALDGTHLGMKPRRQRESNPARPDYTPGAAEALRIYEQYRQTVRHRFLELKTNLRRTLSELSFQLASAAAARLCLQYGPQRTEWLWWRLSSIVDQFAAISTPLNLPASLERLATESLLHKLARDRNV